MRILLIGNYSIDRQYSMQGFVNVLALGLSGRGHEVRVLSARPILGRFGSPVGLGKWLGYLDKYLFFPPVLRRALGRADIVHVCDQGNAIYTRFLQGVPHLLTCHDLLAIRGSLGEISDWSTGFTGRIYQKLNLQGLTQARAVVCVSQATHGEVLRLTDLAPERIKVIYNSLYQPFLPMPTADATAILAPLGIEAGTRFLLHVGSNVLYKNRPMVLKIYNALRRESDCMQYKLVMAGARFTEEMRAYVTAQGLTEHVLERTALKQEQLQALYSQAAGLVFPSLYEGFGLPIIEAQASGCPVFTSNRAPMTEVGGDAAAYFDPTDAEGAARVIAEGLENRERMIQAGFVNVRRFDPELMLDEYLETYKAVLNGSPRAAARTSA